MFTVRIINYIIAVLFFACYFYQFVYMALSVLKKKKLKTNAIYHNFAVLIAARNEEQVIQNLIESINAQTYPKDRITVFVVADNCTDHTAAAAKNAGAVVYERENKHKVGKGYALDFLLERISEDYPQGSFDGYFVFDADNILEDDYIEQMNGTFSQGYDIVTGYRNSKNYGDNWISAGYSLWFLRESQVLNKARSMIGTSCFVSGTGFMFSDRVMRERGGWKYYLLTEDIEFTADTIANGERIGYCEDAMLYDEQPTSLKQSIRQRLRWAKGYLQVISKYGGKLVGGAVKKRNFSCYDMIMSISPAFILTVAAVVVNIAGFFVSLPDIKSIEGIALSVLETLFNGYLMFIGLGLFTLITEWKKIHCSAFKKILYLITFPVFMATYIPISAAALFVKVEWKPITHRRAIGISQIRKAGKKERAYEVQK